MELAGPVPDLCPGIENPKPDIYLSGFTRLGEQVYYYSPTTASRPESTTNISSASEPDTLKADSDPDLIVFCSWMYAFPKHIAKYTKIHQSTYPSSPILLLRQDGGDFFYRSHSQQLKNLEAAVSTIRALSAEKSDKGNLKVLMHVFSNGGAWTVCQLADAYTSSATQSHHQASSPALLPISALILDSTPSLPNSRAAHTALCEALPKSPAALRALGSMAVWGYLSVAHAVDTLSGAEHLTLNIRRRLNDPNGAFMQLDVRRVYIYSQGDALIPAADVEAHAREAMNALGDLGHDKVRLDDFGTTKHVSHMLGDPGRYWGVVGRLWREA
jgi:hypothetical protein